MSSIEEEARRLREEAARAEASRRAAEAASEATQVAAFEREIRERKRRQEEEEIRAASAAEGLIRATNIRELLQEVAKRQWGCGTIKQQSLPNDEGTVTK